MVLLLRDGAACARYRASSGISVEEDGATRRCRPACEAVADDAAPINRLLVTTKSWQTEAAVTPLAHRLAPDAWVILLQNGLGQAETLQALAPWANIALGTTTDGAWRVSEWHICLAGRGDTLIGPTDNGCLTLLEQQCGDLRLANPRLTFVSDIQPRLWRKLVVNCVINPLTAIHRCRNGEILQRAECVQLLPGLCAELAAVASARGHAMDAAEVLELVRTVATTTAGNRSSMLQDVLAGRRTEIEEITGYVCRAGRELGIPTPLNDALLLEVRAMTSRVTA